MGTNGIIECKLLSKTRTVPNPLVRKHVGNGFGFKAGNTFVSPYGVHVVDHTKTNVRTKHQCDCKDEFVATAFSV
jgi:hypothetical protein